MNILLCKLLQCFRITITTVQTAATLSCGGCNGGRTGGGPGGGGGVLGACVSLICQTCRDAGMSQKAATIEDDVGYLENSHMKMV